MIADTQTAKSESGPWPDQPLHQLLYASARLTPERIALVDPANKQPLTGTEPLRLSYRQLTDKIDRLATLLLQCGLVAGDLLLVQMPNIVELVWVYLAASRLGLVVSPVPVQYQQHELGEILRQLEPAAVISVTTFKNDHFVAPLRSAIEKRQQQKKASGQSTPAPQLLVWGTGGDFDLAAAMAQPLNSTRLQDYLDRTSLNADQIFTICWTSGTEGQPKGIPRSHKQWLSVGRATYEGNQIQAGEALLNPFPFINMASIGGLFLSWLYSGGKLVLHHPLDLPVYLQQITEEKISYTLAPPALLNSLLKSPDLLASCDLSSLRAIGSGSAPLDEWMVAGFKQQFDIEIVNHFGSNEGVSLLCGPNETSSASKRARLFPRHNTLLEMRLADSESGELIEATGITGELQIKGPGVFDGYFKDPQKTADAFTDDGFFRTGDLFQISPDEPAFYRFIGRCKDLIIRGGVNIAPAELDNLICAHEDITEAAVTGYPCEVMGERVAAFVVSKSGQELSLEALSRYLKSLQIATFKLPEKVVMIEALPRNPLGKVVRHRLTELLQ